ncbi:hypothetical protein HY251_10780, partial [bacterium]|nr:hypothetical protein [bacterium]
MPPPAPPPSEDGERTIGFDKVIAIPPAPVPPPPEETTQPDLGERTIGFDKVISIPPPGAPATGPPFAQRAPLPNIAPSGTANFQGIMPIPMTAPLPPAAPLPPPPSTPAFGTPIVGPLPLPIDPGFAMSPVSDFDAMLEVPGEAPPPPAPAPTPKSSKVTKAKKTEKAEPEEKPEKGTTSRKALAPRKRGDRATPPAKPGTSGSAGSNNLIYIGIGCVLAAVIVGAAYFLGAFDSKA